MSRDSLTKKTIKKILVVDDEPGFVEMVSEFLSNRKYEVLTAANGEEALQVIKQIPPDLIVLDIAMPKMGGVAFYDRVSLPDGQPMYPTLVCTANSDMEDLFSSLRVDGFITKPFKMEQLLTMIEQIFAKLKALLRSAAARTVPDLWNAIRHAFTRFTPDECRNSLAAAGYDNDLAVAT